MTRSDTLQEETIDEMYYYECPSIKYSRTSCFSSEDEDFDNAIRSCKENESNLNNKEPYAPAPTNADPLGLGVSSPDIRRRNSISSMVSHNNTDVFGLTCRSLPDNNNAYKESSLNGNELKVINKVGYQNLKVQKNLDFVSSQRRRRNSSMGTDVNNTSQSTLKSSRIQSTISTGSRASMNFSRHF